LKVTKAKLAENRVALVEAARSLIQERGFAGAGVADICKAAGLTEGAFYGHFANKAALAAEACRNSQTRLRALIEATDNDFGAVIDGYLGASHVDDIADGCPMAAYTAEVRRQEPDVQKTFLEGFEEVVRLVQAALPRTRPGSASHRRALFLVSAMVGSLAMARAAAGTTPELAEEILSSAREFLKDLGRLKHSA
jgi:TetR/AcrR family transcriptional regulator, transcriptional repressor for nem operon